ncbi:unnamed protein product [Anisakis simplex]|uniref:Uncharacterized protein n=1 Tax=Anisakis simplex TaxID=6269 RepID=A0A0M3K8U7_ANISI|nr:unnamed protein product [Anisakis simplex]
MQDAAIHPRTFGTNGLMNDFSGNRIVLHSLAPLCELFRISGDIHPDESSHQNGSCPTCAQQQTKSEDFHRRSHSTYPSSWVKSCSQAPFTNTTFDCVQEFSGAVCIVYQQVRTVNRVVLSLPRTQIEILTIR